MIKEEPPISRVQKEQGKLSFFQALGYNICNQTFSYFQLKFLNENWGLNLYSKGESLLRFHGNKLLNKPNSQRKA